ncbi:TetR/AcrR family transcriptional regulator [Kerstersia gyiorum]|uniref:TetR/AcrR family transcriptional regulator n=1 Tax=Kerstersia gyiorum TaxID=206506 RepID=UPI00214F6413|nr:TetR/AcrR family transcriptional regulator [Kerstersia gyiorum]MCR4158374.1 TetR/AcrR family transcriptional regulator [Kerstersia gyiorum]
MTTRPRGRPRAYDPDQVLERALQAFWKSGYSGTSLDALAAATGLNRPSLYAGLGDKRTIYIKAMRRFQAHAREHFGAALQPQPDDQSFADVIARYLRAAIKVDGLQEDTSVSGCAVISTATAEALTDPEIRQVLDDVLEEMDGQLLTRLQAAQAQGELPQDTDVEAMAFLMSSTAHSIGIRARAGQAKQDMERMVDSLARALCPATPKVIPSRKVTKAPPAKAEQ